MSRVRSVLALFLAAVVLAACNTSTTPDVAAPDLTAPALPSQYIVVLKTDGLSAQSAQAFALQVNSLATEFKVQVAAPLQLIDGFVVTNTDAATAARLAADPRVAYMQPDRIVTLPPFRVQGKPSGGGSQPTQTVPWGIKRIGAVGLGNKGANVDVFVVDTGIDSDHPNLQPIVDGYAPVACKGRNCRQSWDDDNEHGTHVSGTIAARANTLGVVGVAPAANLHAVKVLNAQGSGSYSGIIQGIQWVTRYSAANPRVINMSLGGTGTDTGCNNGTDALHDAVCAAVKAGVTVVVAAGNENDNAANHTPAAYDEAITVSATGNEGDDGVGNYDFFAYFTNWGPDVDIAGPGYHVLSSVPGGGYATFSGTSMATPHTAGAAALYLSTHRSASPAAVRSALIAATTSTSGFRNDSSGAHPEGMLNVSSF
ncbi:subtilisin AprE [soil metagenome]